jgi:protein-glutamine gamma-glutamyltransferase
MAVMLRTLDVPTRNVTGFAGGTYNRFGNFYVVRQGDAHSWVEVYLDGRGWITFDPTPPASALPLSQEGALSYLRDLLEATSQRWDRHVVGYDFQQQVGLLSTLSSRYQTGARRFPGWSKRRVAIGVGLLLVAGAGIVLIVLHRRRQKERPPPGERTARSVSALLATSLYEMLDAAMSAAGVGRSPGTPPLRHAEALQEMGHPLGDDIASLTQLYLDARFGGRVLEEEDRRDFEARVRALQHSERRAAAEAFAQAS